MTGSGASDLARLERAAELSKAGWPAVRTNPLVGCVIVRDGEIVGEGAHLEFGGPHAEVVALRAAGERAAGAAAFVTLEPCRHEGKTPPCTEALLEAGVERVVYGAADPGAESGGGAAVLAERGVEVVGPVWSPERARAENPAFHYLASRPGPYVALKLAMSLDACIAAVEGASTRISGPTADREVHRLRSGFDALLVGAGTARVDDPRLTVRLAEPGPSPPRRIVLDPAAGLSPGARLFDDVDRVPLDVFVASDAPESRTRPLEDAGAGVHRVGGAGGRLELSEVWARCASLGVATVLCEGGARLAASLLSNQACRRMYLVVAPRLIGAAGLPAFAGATSASLAESFRPALAPRALGDDVLLVYDRGSE